uniref:Ion transport domain-containing protein n=1 Tax=Rhizophagus irregularis (strain DAOM 181602 / DAOM 197198 / MUCL 43194) TaxID=747089 RepID=U9US43_RHIID
MSSDKISIKVDDDISNDLKDEINKIDENDIINDDSDIDINKPAYIDKPIIKVSPNGEYLVVYNPEDHSIVGWNVKDIEEGQLTKSDAPVKVNDSIDQISVSDDKKLAYTFYKKNEYLLKIIDINNNQKIKLSLNIELLSCPYHTFNLKYEFLLYDNWNTYDRYYHKKYKIIWIYSTQAKNYKWICKRIYKIPEYFELINMSKYDKLYLISNNSIYEWDLDAEKGTKIFYINDKEFKSHYNNSLYKSVKYSKLLPSLLPLLSSKTLNPIMEYCWEKCLTRLGLKDENLQTLPSNFQTTDKYAFGILDGNVWKIKLEENISKINFSSQNSDVQVIEDSNDYFDEHLNINLFKSYMDEIRELFQKLSNSKSEYKRKLKQNDQNLVERIIITDKLLQVWKIKIIGHNKIMLRVFKKADVKRKWELTDTKITKFNVSDARKIKLLEIKLFTDDDIILITTIGFLIYHFNENKKSMSLIYWNYLELTYPNVGTLNFEDPEFFGDFKALLKPYYTLQFNLPLLNYDSFKICDEWISYVKDNKGNLLKYGDKLLSFAIKEHKLDLIEEIYKKCISWFNEDLGNNWMFLSIITSTTPLLNKYYPEYILRYSLETTMIIDHPFYSIEYQHTKSLYSFQYLQLVDLTRSILWSKYKFFLHGLLNNYETIFWILIILRLLILIVMILLLPFFLIYIAVFYILEKYHFINEIFDIGVFSTFYFVLSNKLTTRETPIITFMVPYINFVNYSKDYNWFLELIKPQPSPFTETINRNIYKTWNGEAIINFKWNTYGKYYYAMIWILFMALLGCFTAAATIPQQYINEEVRQQLFIASIIFGFIHLSFEVRQFIYNPLKWFYDFWNIFGI